MTGRRTEPRAVLVLVDHDREAFLCRIGSEVRCDLGLLDRILRLHLAAARWGWSVRLAQVDHDLRALVELTGLADRIVLPVDSGTPAA